MLPAYLSYPGRISSNSTVEFGNSTLGFASSTVEFEKAWVESGHARSTRGSVYISLTNLLLRVDRYDIKCERRWSSSPVFVGAYRDYPIQEIFVLQVTC